MYRNLIVIFLFSLSLLHAEVLKLKSAVYTDQTEIYLSDLVELTDLDIAVRNSISSVQIISLENGRQFQNLSVKQINQILQNQHINQYSIQGQLVTIYPKNSILAEDQILKTVKLFLIDQLKADETTEIELLKPPVIKLKNQRYTLSVKSNPSMQLSGRMILSLQVKFPDQKTDEYTINAKLYKTYEVYKLKNSKKLSDRFTAEDLELNYVREMLTNKYKLSYQEILESVASAYCPKGKIITTSDIRSEPLIRKSDVVVVNIIGKNFNMKYNALAKNDAWMGEQVTLQNQDTKRFFNAKVVDKNTAAIYLEEK